MDVDYYTARADSNGDIVPISPISSPVNVPPGTDPDNVDDDVSSISSCSTQHTPTSTDFQTAFDQLQPRIIEQYVKPSLESTPFTCPLYDCTCRCFYLMALLGFSI